MLRKVLFSACALAIACGCGDGNAAPGPGSRPIGGGNDDGDDGAVDGGTDPSSDGSTPEDAGRHSDASAPGGEDGGLSILDCNIPADDRFTDTVAIEGGRAFALAAAGNELHVLYVTPTCTSGTNVTGTGLKYAKVATSGLMTAGSPFVNNDPTQCETTSDPALAIAGDKVTAYFVTRDETRLEAHHVEVGSGARPLSFTNAIERESWLAATTLAGTPLVAWVSGDVQAPEAIWSMRHGDVLRSAEFLAESKGHFPSSLALHALDASTTLLAWVSTGSVVGIFTQTMNQFAEPRDSIQVASMSPGAVGDVDIATAPITTGDAAGALVYTSGSADAQEVRFRTIGARGQVAPSDRSISSGGSNARDPSITPYGAGYAVAYRAFDGPGLEQRVIQLAFIDEQGSVAGYRNIARAAPGGGAVRVRQANDGRLFVAWVDAGPTGRTITVARLLCQ